MQLREKFWLWGHPEGRYNNEFGNTSPSRMTPMEACLYLGIRNTFMVPVGVDLSRRQYNKSFTTLRQVGWECFSAAKDPFVVDPLIEEANDFPNISCVVLDDFVMQAADSEVDAIVENLWKIRDRLHNNSVRKLDMWMVLYTQEFGKFPQADERVRRFIEPFDGVIMWTWRESDVPLIPEKYEIFKKLAPNQRYMFGCYLWNFGEEKPATREAVNWQLDWYYDKLQSGEAEGVVLHTNTMADLDLDAYDAAIDWMKQHGDDELPD